MTIVGALPLGVVGAFGGNGGGPSQMARLGNFVFGIDTLAFDELRRRSSYDWQVMRRAGRAVANQYVGGGDDEIALPGTLYPAFRGGLGHIASLRAMAESGLPHRLMYDYTGASSDAGQWVITGIDETRRVLMRDGAPRAVDFTVTLRAYGEDAPATTKNTGEASSLTSRKLVSFKAAAPSVLAPVAALASSTPASLAGLLAVRSTALTLPTFAANPAAATSAISSLASSGASLLSSARSALSAGISIAAPFAPPGAIDPIARAAGAVGSILATLEGVGRPAGLSEIVGAADRISAAASSVMPGLRDAATAISRVQRVTEAAFSAANGPQAAAVLPALRAMGASATSMISGVDLISDTAKTIKGRL